MKMNFYVAAVAAVLSLGLAVPAQASLITNGSFEEPLFANTTDTTLAAGVSITDGSPSLVNNLGGSGSQRIASTSTTATIVIPGFTFETSGSFTGVNNFESTSSDTGASSVVINTGGFITATSDPFAIDAGVDELLVSGAFSQLQAGLDSGSDFSFSIIFSTPGGDVETFLADEEAFTAITPTVSGSAIEFAEQFDDVSVAVPADATSAVLQFQLDPNGGAQLAADSFSVVAVPEPASVALAMLGLVGVAARRRRV